MKSKYGKESGDLYDPHSFCPYIFIPEFYAPIIGLCCYILGGISMNVAFDQINSQDAANIIGVSISKLHQLRKSGQIDAINIGEGSIRGRYLYNRDDIEKYIRDRDAELEDAKPTYSELMKRVEELESENLNIKRTLDRIEKRAKLILSDIEINNV